MAESYEPTNDELPYAVFGSDSRPESNPPLPPRGRSHESLLIDREFYQSQGSSRSSLTLPSYQNDGRTNCTGHNRTRSSLTLNHTFNLSESFESPGSTRDIPRVPSEILSSPDILLERTGLAETDNGFMLSRTNQVEAPMHDQGVFVKSDLNTSNGEWVNSLEQLVEMYNSDDTGSVLKSKLKKFIVTSVLINLRQRKDILGISKLLHLSSDVLRPIVESTILEETLEMQFDSSLLPEISKAVHTILDVLVAHPESQTVMITVLNLFSQIYVNKVFRDSYVNEIGEAIRHKCKQIQCKHKRKQKAIQVIVVKEFVHNVKEYDDETPDKFNSETTVENKKRLFDRMEFRQKYVLLYGMLNGMLTSIDTGCCKQIHDMIQFLVDWKPKQKSYEMLHKDLMLRLVTMAYCRLLVNETFIDLHPRNFLDQLLDTIDLIFLGTNVSQESRLSLIEMLEPLLFVGNREIVIRILAVFRKNCNESVPVAKIVHNHIRQAMLHTDVQLKPMKCLNEEAPVWKTSDGFNLSSRRNVTLKCHIPSLYCLTNKDQFDKNNSSNHLHCLRVLRKLQDKTTHRSVLQLMAYQVKLAPIFYITEKVSPLTLNEFLLTKRKSSRWLPTRDLLTVAIEVADAMEFLHRKSVVHRDITTHSFRVCERGSRLVLHEFSLAFVLESEQQAIKTPDSQEIPTLWSAPESILEDRYSPKSDVWMIGSLIYELFTHGCRPYTEMYTFSVEKILQYVLFHDLHLKSWPCIPKDVYGLIRDLHHRKSSGRPDTATVKQRLERIVDKTNKSKKTRCSFLEECDKLYPKFDVTQDRVDRGIPNEISQMKRKSLGDAESIYASYQTLQVSRTVQASTVEVQITELTAADRPKVELKADMIKVREPITEAVLQTLRDHMEGHMIKNVLMMTKYPTFVEGSPLEGIDRMLEYEMKCEINVSDLASSRRFGDPLEKTAKQKYLEVILMMAEFVDEMNSCSWILGSMRCLDLYVAEGCGKVVMARLGKLIWFNPSCYSDDYIVADYCSSDCMRWCPVEVIQHRHFSFASDIYSLAMTILEFYTILSLHQGNLGACETETAPFPNVSSDNLPELLYSDGKPDRPESCPEWLYSDLIKCLSKDVEKRPPCKHLATMLKKKLEYMARYPDINGYYLESEDEDYVQSDHHYVEITEFNCVNSDSDEYS